MKPLASTVHGPTDAPPLVLLHGWLGDGRDWDAVLQHLGGRFRCVLLDLPGHGASPDAVPGGLAVAAAALWATLDGLGIAQAALAGYSMGGRLALHAALARPERCLALAILAASPGLATPAERTGRAAADDATAATLLAHGLPWFLADWYRQPLFSGVAGLPEAERDAWMARRAAAPPERLAAALRHLSVGRQASLWPRLPHLASPSLWLAGTADARYLATARAAAAAAPGGRFAALEGCSHALLVEAPAQVARHLAGFAADLAPSTPT